MNIIFNICFINIINIKLNICFIMDTIVNTYYCIKYSNNIEWWGEIHQY